MEIDEDGEPTTPSNAKTKLCCFHKHGPHKHGPRVREGNDRSFVFSQELREAAIRLVDLIKAMAKRSFVPDQEKDELTMTLGNPEHPRCCRGTGHIDSYRSRQRSKAEHAQQLRELQEHVALTEARMKETIDRRVALALSKQASEQVAAASGVASTEAPAGGSSDIFEDNQRHPVDDIIGRAPCELVTSVKNKLIVVAYRVAKQPIQGQTLHGVEIPTRSYAKVGVDRVVDDWDDLELEIPGGDREKNLGEAIHGWILWPKRYIRIMQSNPPTLGSSPQGSRARSPTPSARAPSPLPDRDPSMSPPPPIMSMATRRNMPSVPPTTATKKQNKPKEKQPEPKNPCDMTNAELHVVVDAEVKAHFTKKRSVKKDPPLDKEKPSLSDYDRQITKAFQKKKKSGSTIPQLGTQSNQSIAPLKVLLEFDQNLLQFIKDTNLTLAQLRGEDHIPKHPEAAKWKYEYGKPLMYKLHQWYMEVSANGLFVLEVQIGGQHYFRGEDIINVPLEELYYLYNQDALDKSLISSWVLMEIQTCQTKGYYDVGFIDSDDVNYFHQILLVVMVDQNMVYVMDSLRKPRDQYKNLIDILNKAWARFRRHHAGEFKEELDLKPEFPQPGNNLCGYYVCEFIHGFMMYMKERLLDTEKIKAIQEQLSGFLLEEVVNPAREFHNDGSNLHHRQDSGPK
uniref:Uncharacterized protein n=1 Tax=Setaria viridis TaxID=4556 RepID=A0A4U6UY20_SETVI|nr:hypothetical protein SEVIR_4G127700v2 [Setaria viridis]